MIFISIYFQMTFFFKIKESYPVKQFKIKIIKILAFSQCKTLKFTNLSI